MTRRAGTWPLATRTSSMRVGSVAVLTSIGGGPQ
jgi:hypothetical protein